MGQDGLKPQFRSSAASTPSGTTHATPPESVSAGKHSPRATRSLLHHGSKYDVELLSATAADGSLRTRACVRHPGAVIILPILEIDGRKQVLFIRSYRLTVERYLLELPAGTREGDEDPAACAVRELEEETGFVAGSLHPLSSFLTSPGLSDERMWAFVATNLRPTRQRLEPDEDIEVVPTDVQEAWRLFVDPASSAAPETLEDAKSMLTLLLARERGFL